MFYWYSGGDKKMFKFRSGLKIQEKREKEAKVFGFPMGNNLNATW